MSINLIWMIPLAVIGGALFSYADYVAKLISHLIYG